MTNNPASLTTQQADLVRMAIDIRRSAYAPYSNFLVGAALLADDGRVFVGCNVENASYSLCVCAERVAGGTAVANGSRKWTTVAVASRGGVTPCGACRQWLGEFGDDLVVLCVDAETKAVTNHLLRDLLPHAFNKSSLAT